MCLDVAEAVRQGRRCPSAASRRASPLGLAFLGRVMAVAGSSLGHGWFLFAWRWFGKEATASVLTVWCKSKQRRG